MLGSVEMGCRPPTDFLEGLEAGQAGGVMWIKCLYFVFSIVLQS